MLAVSWNKQGNSIDPADRFGPMSLPEGCHMKRGIYFKLNPLAQRASSPVSAARCGRSATETIMWRAEKEYRVAQLLDDPVLGLALASRGMERRSIELLLETASGDRAREHCRPEEPILA